MRLQDLQSLIAEDRGGTLRDEVRMVLGDNLLPLSYAAHHTPILPQGVQDTRGDEYTKVFVWGDRNSGKTCLIGSLMAAAKADEGESLTVVDGDERSIMMKKCFESNDLYSMLPDEQDRTERVVTIHNVSLRKRNTLVSHRSYPVSFIEVPLTIGVKGGAIAKDILDKEGEQIHLLCLDSTGDIMLQGQMFTRLLNYLDDNDYISNKTVGVFIAVTKTDTMYRVPREYRDMAAQTMVTARLRGLWHKVCNICYDKGIYGATPVTYTVGDVKLQSIVQLDLSTARTLWHSVILPKSQSRMSGLEKLLRWGNGSLTAAAFLAFIVLAGYGLYGVLKPDATPPDAVNKPYDYKAEFIKKVQNEMQTTTYNDCKKHYIELKDELEQEHLIYTIDNSPVLSEKEYASCDSALSNSFAKVINAMISNEMSQSSWDDVLLKELQSRGRGLLTHNLTPSLNNETEQKTQLVAKYFDEVKPLVEKINNCQSLHDVEFVMEKSDEYREAPFTSNAAIADALTNAKQNSIKSYSEYLMQQVTNVEANNNDKTSFAIAMGALNSNIDEFTTYLREHGYSQFVTELENAKQELQAAYNNLSTSLFDYLF